jgi:hypothetical protein
MQNQRAIAHQKEEAEHYDMTGNLETTTSTLNEDTIRDSARSQQGAVRTHDPRARSCPYRSLKWDLSQAGISHASHTGTCISRRSKIVTNPHTGMPTTLILREKVLDPRLSNTCFFALLKKKNASLGSLPLPGGPLPSSSSSSEEWLIQNE